MKFYIETFGCKVNSYESSYMESCMLKEGFIKSSLLSDADIIIINTCTVTNVADSKCKKFVRRVRRENEKSILAVVGCSTQNNFSEYQNMNIDIILGNSKKSEIVNIIKEYIKTGKHYEYVTNNRDLSFEDMEIVKFNHTRAFIKIQDGCDNFCSYCIIPFTRGKCRSKNFDQVIAEVNNLVKNGHKEIVLTGIHTGSYNDNGKDLVDLINEISKIDGLYRIRLSSVEITELDDKFLSMLKNNDKFCHHLHIPIQSGCNEILKKMNRKYDLDYFLNKVNVIRSIIPDISLTTDLIVGFPGETEDNFKKTYETMKKIKFSKIHVFPYSSRTGTVASKLKEVSSVEKTNRVHKILELSNVLEKEYSELFKGKNVDVLIEEIKNDVSIGHTSNYLKVEINDKLERNEIVSVIYN